MVYSSWETEPLSGPCKLLSWTRVYALPEGYERKFLMFAMVELENGLRASGRLETEDEEPRIGMDLLATVETSDERPGKEVNVFVFRPA